MKVNVKTKTIDIESVDPGTTAWFRSDDKAEAWLGMVIQDVDGETCILDLGVPDGCLGVFYHDIEFYEMVAECPTRLVERN